MNSRMRRVVVVSVLLLALGLGGIFLHSISAERYAQSATNVIETGKSALFSRSVSGALQSFQIFQSGLAGENYSAATNAEKIKLRVYLALTRLLDVVLREDASAGTLAGLASQFGISHTGDLFDAIVFSAPLNNTGKLVLPEGAPASANALKAFFAGPFLVALNASIADLDAAIALCPASGEGDDVEIIARELLAPGDPYQPNLEMDAGDYWLFRSLLKILKTYALMSAGYNADIDLREIASLVNLDGNLKAVKQLLDRHPDFLTISDNAKLNEVRLTLIEAITDYETASARIRADATTTAGAEELFALEVESRQEERFIREEYLAKIKASLQNNTVAAIDDPEETWTFTTTHGEISAKFQGGFTSGFYDTYGASGCNTTFGCSGYLDYALTDVGSVLFKFYGYDGYVTFQGTFNAEKTSITSGTYSGYRYMTGAFSGNFNGTRTEYIANTTRVNPFAILGNGAAGSAAAIRDMLPQIGEQGCLIPMTVGHGLGDDPTFSGFLPDSTQDIWMNDFGEFFPPVGSVTIPAVADNAINVQDGTVEEWTGAPVFTDKTGEVWSPYRDIAALYLAKDSQYLYMRIDTAGAWPTINTWEWFSWAVFFRHLPGNQGVKSGDLEVRLSHDWGSSTFSGALYKTRVDSGFTYSSWLAPLNSGDFQVVGNHVEMRAPLAQLGEIGGRFLGVDANGWSPSDRNGTCLQIQPVATIAGTLNVPGYDGFGPVRISVQEFSGAYNLDPAARLDVQTVYPDASGTLPDTYAITGLPVGKTVSVCLWWDRDQNGVYSSGDYGGWSSPFTTSGAATTKNLQTAVEVSSFPSPEFTTAVTRYRQYPGGALYELAATLKGPAPADVTVTATGPGGEEYSLSPTVWIENKDGVVYYCSRSYLQNGDYTFTAVDTVGRKATKVCRFEARYDLSGVTNLKPADRTYAGTTTPTLSWTPPATGGPYAYQVMIADYSNSRNYLYLSDVTTAASLTVPSGILKADSAYTWFVRLFDGAGGPLNYTQSAANAIYTGSYDATPAFESIWLGTLQPPSGSVLPYSHRVQAYLPGIAPWDITGWRLNKGSGLIAEGSGAPNFWGNFLLPQFSLSDWMAPGNDYAFELDINNHAGGTAPLSRTELSYDEATRVETVSYLSLRPGSNQYFSTPTPTFSWAAVGAQDPFYRLRIVDYLNLTTVYSSPWAKTLSATAPAGILKPGRNYLWTVMTSPADITNQPDGTSYTIAFTNTGTSYTAFKSFSILSLAKGDVGGDGDVDMADAILALRVASGLDAAVSKDGDANGDSRIGLPDAIYILQTVGGLRQELGSK